jgi:hypothetical protein
LLQDQLFKMQLFDSQIIVQIRYGTRLDYVSAVVVTGIVPVVMRFLSIKRGFESQEQMEQKDVAAMFQSFPCFREWTVDLAKPPLLLLRRPAQKGATDLGISSSLLISTWKMRMRTEYLSLESISSFVESASKTLVSS